MAEVQQNDGGAKAKTTRKDANPRGFHADGRHEHVAYHILHALYDNDQITNSDDIALPSNEKVDNVENMSQASADDAVTIILDAKRKTGSFEVDTVNGKIVPVIYYYFGKPGGDAGLGNTPESVSANNNLQESEFLGNDEKSGAARGIRAIIQQRNKEVLTEVNKLKEKYANGGFGSLETKDGREQAQAAYDEAASKVRKDENLKKPIIIIKSTPQASFGSLVEVLDEMQINSISKYQIDNMTKADSTMVIDYQNRHHK